MDRIFRSIRRVEWCEKLRKNLKKKNKDKIKSKMTMGTFTFVPEETTTTTTKKTNIIRAVRKQMMKRAEEEKNKLKRTSLKKSVTISFK